MFAVAGVSGKTGAATADALLARGQRVRVIVRDAAKGAPWAAKGAEVAVADLADRAAVAAALQGVQGAYLLVPPVWGAANPVAAGAELGRGLAAAAREAGVPHVVLLSSVGAHLAADTGPIGSLFHAEAAFRQSGVPTTALRASYFVENWGSVAHVAKTEGVLPSFIAADHALAQVCTRDIGVTAADLLLAGPSGHRVVELRGPSEVTPAEVAAGFGRVLGREIALVTPPLEAAEAALVGAGLPQPWAALYAEMYRGLSTGVIRPEPGQPQRRGATPIEDTLRALVA